MSQTIKAMSRVAKRAIREKFAPYAAMDDFGTFQPCWTEREALSWLPSLSADGRVIKGGHTIARRTVSQ